MGRLYGCGFQGRALPLNLYIGQVWEQSHKQGTSETLGVRHVSLDANCLQQLFGKTRCPAFRGLGDAGEAELRCTHTTGKEAVVSWEAEIGLSPTYWEQGQSVSWDTVQQSGQTSESSYRQQCLAYHITQDSQPVTWSPQELCQKINLVLPFWDFNIGQKVEEHQCDKSKE
jgi:hypothetical protein